MSVPELPDGFLAALLDLTAWLDGEQVDYAMIGGVSVSLLAQPRTTNDIDVVVWLERERWEEFLNAAAGRGLVPRLDDALAFADASRVLLLRHQRSGVGVDVSFGALEFEREMIERAAALRIGGLSLRVPTPEDLIITKAVAQRPKDIADIESLLNVCRGLDVRHIRRWVGEFAAALEMPEMLDNLEKLLRSCQTINDESQ